MKNIFLSIGVSFLIFGCGNTTSDNNQEIIKEVVAEEQEKYDAFGAEITDESSTEATTFIADYDGKEKLVKLSATINEVCQKKGCWMTLNAGEEKELMVRFKDYEFFVPKDAPGKNCVVEGIASIDTISVEELQHYASDAGKSEEEIAEIIEPEITYSLEATGVLIEK